MTVRNPFRSSGKFLTVDMVAALEPEVKRSRTYHDHLVSQRRMKPENRDAKVGCLEALLEMLKSRMVRESRAGTAENEGEQFIIYLHDPRDAQEFLKWAEQKDFRVSRA